LKVVEIMQKTTAPSAFDLSNEEIAKLAELVIEAKGKAYCTF
jgi:hypothetical protein